MTPQDLIRSAAKIIETQGWCSGTDSKGKIVHVRDQSGIALPLYRGDNTGQDKAKVNSGARSFSIYGALAKALHEAGGAVADPGGMWTVLQGLALAEGPQTERAGGTNWVHPVIAFNEREGQTKDGVLAFLERCAVEFEPDAADRIAAAQEAAFDIGPADFEPEPVIHTHVERQPSAIEPSYTILNKDVAPVKAPVPQIKPEPTVEAAKATLPPINWGES